MRDLADPLDPLVPLVDPRTFDDGWRGRDMVLLALYALAWIVIAASMSLALIAADRDACAAAGGSFVMTREGLRCR